MLIKITEIIHIAAVLAFGPNHLCGHFGLNLAALSEISVHNFDGHDSELVSSLICLFVELAATWNRLEKVIHLIMISSFDPLVLVLTRD